MSMNSDPNAGGNILESKDGSAIQVRCQCHTEAVEFSLNDISEPTEVYLSAWNYGNATDFGRLIAPWRTQLHAIWQILRHGNTWYNNIVLSSDRARAVGKKLLDFADKIDAFETSSTLKRMGTPESIAAIQSAAKGM